VGFTYNKYLNICAEAARKCVKDSVVKKYQANDYISYRKLEYKDGKPLYPARVTVTNDSQA